MRPCSYRRKKVQLSGHDLMYQGLHTKSSRVFPGHTVRLSDTFQLELVGTREEILFLNSLKKEEIFLR